MSCEAEAVGTREPGHGFRIERRAFSNAVVGAASRLVNPTSRLLNNIDEADLSLKLPGYRPSSRLAFGS